MALRGTLLIIITGIAGLEIISRSGCAGQSPNDVHVYVLGFMNISMDKPYMKGFQQILISSTDDATVRIEIPYIGVDEYIVLNAYNGRKYMKIVETDLVTAKGEGPRAKGVRITGTRKLNIQAVKAKSATGDGFLSLPITTNAKQFLVMSATPTPEEHSVVLIAALYPDTCLEGYAVRGSKYRKIRGLIQLQEFDIYQLESDTDDLTGVYINSSKPIAVFAGHECLQEPSYTRFCDHSVIQVPPLSDWGTKYIVPPIEGRSARAGYSVRVLSSEKANRVTVGSTKRRHKLDRGSHLHANVTDASSVTLVTCSKPCLVAQYGRSWKYVSSDVMTDPFMTLIPPVDRYIRSTTFSTAKFYDRVYHRDFDYKRNYLAAVTRNAKQNEVHLDGKAIAEGWQRFDKSTFVATVPISRGFHRLSLSESSRGTVMGFVYGHALQVPSGYGYPLGYKLKGQLVDWEWIIPATPEPKPTVTECKINTEGTRAPDLIYYFHAGLKNRARPGCGTEYMSHLSYRLTKVKDNINKLICNKVICPRLSGTGVKSIVSKWIRDETYVTGIDIDVIMTTSIDDRVGDLYKCRQSVLQAISAASWWQLPKIIPDCPLLDFSGIFPRSEASGVLGRQMKWEGCH